MKILNRIKALVQKKVKPSFNTRILEELLDTIGVNCWYKDRNGKYIGFNRNITHVLGVKSADEIIGKTDYELPWAESADALTQQDNFVINSGQIHTQEEIIPIEKGKTFTFLVTKAPYRDEQGNIIGTVGTSVDITPIKEANQTKTNFIRNMEHDLRTPLSGILGLSQYLLEQEMEPTKKEFLEMIFLSSQELLDYNNQILDFSKIDAGAISRVIDKKFKLSQLVNKIITVEKPVAAYKKLKLILKHDPAIPQIVIGDDYRIYRILINLVSNAIKFTEQGSVELKTQLVQTEQKEILIRFRVKDTGIGISQEKRDFIFERFSRLSPSNKGFYKGIGLGLRVVKQFMEDLQGEIDLVSKEGEGTEFICTIPFKRPLTDDFLE